MCDRDLFGKTFDQQVQIGGNEVTNRDIAPNRRVAAEIVFEPMGPGVRVTARDEHHRVLWGYVGCKETLKQIHCLVAVYSTLQDLLSEELQKRGLYCPEAKDPMAAAQAALDDIEETVKWLRESLDVQKVTEATLTRAKRIARIASDADKQLTLEAGYLKGMKPRTEQLL
jgi:hypothetical protein